MRLPDDVDVSRGLPFDIAGGGRIRGFALAMAKYPVAKAPKVAWIQSGRCLKRACDPGRVNGPTRAWAPLTSTLPEGVYRLWFFADGPMQLTLRFAGFKAGKIDLEPRDRHLSQVEVLEPHVSAERSAFYAGELVSERLARAADISAMSLWVKTDRWVETEVGDCFYEYPDDRLWWLRSVPEEVLFAPPCRFGESSLEDGYRWVFQNPNGPTGRGRLITFDVLDWYTNIGLGGWARTTGTVKNAGAIGFWMDLRPSK